MTIQHIQDAVLFRLSGTEVGQILETQSMVYEVWLRIVDDWSVGQSAGRWTPRHPPMTLVPDAEGETHLLHCQREVWEYFLNFDSANAVERTIRGEMLLWGLSGAAARRPVRPLPLP